MYKASLLILFLVICHVQFAHAQTQEMPVYEGVKNILAGNPDKSVSEFSKAIGKDSLNWENYYFRGIARAHLHDTVNCINDFFKAFILKKKQPKPQTDTIINIWLSLKPTPSHEICSPSLSNKSYAFFEIWLGFWILLNETNQEGACESFKHARDKGIQQIEPYFLKLCK